LKIFLIFFQFNFVTLKQTHKTYLLMIKKLLCFGLMTFSSTSLLGQLIELKPSDLQLPRVSALSGCAVADYGKMVFLTTTNRANVCGSSGWVEVSAATSSLTLPYTGSVTSAAAGFSVTNSIGGSNSAGIQGITSSPLAGASGILGTATQTAPNGDNAGVRGVNNSINAFGYGVAGTNSGIGPGVYGFSTTGSGVYGTSGSTAAGVSGFSSQPSGTGTYGYANNTSGFGVWGRAASTSVGGYFSHESVNGVSLLTQGTIRFGGLGAATNKILVSTDANGSAVWGNPTRTEIMKLGPASFQSHISQNESVMDGRGIYMSSAAGSFHASVTVPNGATLTRYKIYYVDNDGTNGLTSYSIQRMVNSGNNSYMILDSGNFTNSAASTGILSVQSNLNEIVDNTLSYYRIVVTMPASANLTLVGAEITYTYQVNN
jgi:hypothetical protein